MPKTFKLQIVTPERQAMSEDVTSVILPGLQGEFGVLSGHAPMLVALKAGLAHITRETTGDTYAITGGFAEVTPERVIVLADAIEGAYDVDVERAKKARQKAEERLAKKPEGTDIPRAQAALERAKARLKVAEGAKTKK